MANAPFKARASLIERLVDNHPKRAGEARPLRTQSRKRLKESIRRDLSWLFNTRTPLPGREYDSRELTVIDYGIPDFGSSFTANLEDHGLLTRRLLKAINTFEPRLRHVRIQVNPTPSNERSLSVSIEAMVVVDEVRTPVSFQTILQSKTGTWEIHDNES